MVIFKRVFILMAGTEALYEWYPDSRIAKLLCEFAGKEKLSDKQIKVLKEIGFDIYLVQHVRDEDKRDE